MARRTVYKTKRTSCESSCYAKHGHSRTALGECLTWCKYGSKRSFRRPARGSAIHSYRHAPRRQKRFSYADGNEGNGDDKPVGVITIAVVVIVVIVILSLFVKK